MDNNSISLAIGVGTVCLFIGIYLGNNSLQDNISVLKEIRQECEANLESAADGDMTSLEAFSNFESWLNTEAETARMIHDSGTRTSERY